MRVDILTLFPQMLRSPLELSRVSSSFGMRRHPIHRSWRAHTGVDYAAPTGTRVRAVGDGIVEFAGRQNGYGNLVILRHDARVSTYYAHLNGIGRGIRTGARVAQGDILGTVGQTGWATGPHLHYEFRVAGTARNPLAVALPDGAPVAWLLRMLGAKGQARINGPDLMLRYCAHAASTGESIYLYGASQATLDALVAFLKTLSDPQFTADLKFSDPFR